MKLKIAKNIRSAKKRDQNAKASDDKWCSDLNKRTGVDMEDTLKNLNQMSKVILDTPELMQDAEKADKMLLAAIYAKLEIIELL